MPPLGELLAALRVVSIPMRVPFRGVRHREAALFEGPCGWGEFAPFLEYDVDEAARWLASAIESAYAPWPALVRDVVPVNATVPAVAAADVAAVLARFDGCHTVKVKVAQAGQCLADDLDRVAAVRDAVGWSDRVRIDANGAWSVGQAVAAIDALRAYRLEYVEQPCASVEELRDLRISLARRGFDVPIAADESIRKAADPLRVARLRAADLAVVKVAPLGGVRRALDIVAECGLPAVVSSALDTSVGVAAGVALAAALPALDHACGLGTVELLSDDVATDPIVPQQGMLAAIRPVIDEEALLRLTAAPDRFDWWRDRLARCHALLAGT